MKKTLILSMVVLALVLYTSPAQAQFNPYAEDTKLLSVGIGVSGWGIPVFGRFDLPVADNITVGGGLSYQSYNYSSSWNLNIIGITARGSYHFNELIDIDDQWDIYGGLSLNYFITSYNWDGPGTGGSWTGGGPDGIGVGLHVGGRYFFTEKLGANLELGGGSSLSGALLGVTFLL